MSAASRTALILIDLQNDYMPGGAFPLWNTGPVLDHIRAAITHAQAAGARIAHVRHVADPTLGLAPFFNEATHGAAIEASIAAAAPEAPIVIKHHADSFHATGLGDLLADWGVDTLLIAGMMTQNCVTHTAISKAAERFRVVVLVDCTTTVSEMLHLIALHALSTRVELLTAEAALASLERDAADHPRMEPR
jgi:nicotinamidase-related amidase